MPEVTPLWPDDPRRVGRYQLTGRFDSLGGADDATGVFMARRVDGGRVVVSLLGAGRAADPAARDRFTAEARSATRVAPLCAAKIIDSGFAGDAPYLVTEFVPGPSLTEVLTQEGALAPEVLEALAVGTATGLAAIHQSGLVHGQFGPDYVVLSPEGPRVVHFSITPPYGAATPAADILAWAHTILLAGLGHPLAHPGELAGLPETVASAVASCLTPDPGTRPNARFLLAQLLSRPGMPTGLLAEGTRRAQAAARAAAPPGDPAPHQSQSRTHPRPRFRALSWAGAAAIGAVVLAGLVYLAVRPDTAPAGSSAAASPRTPAPAAVVPAQFAGRWSGSVHQTNPVLTVTVQIVLAAGSAQGSVDYPGLGCSGRLSVASVAPGTLTVRQVIQSGRRKCEDGTITLASSAGGHLTFTFLRSGGADPTGTLTRQSG